jgi:hypothetical protein
MFREKISSPSSGFIEIAKQEYCEMHSSIYDLLNAGFLLVLVFDPEDRSDMLS